MTQSLGRALRAFFKMGPLEYMKQLNRIADPKIGRLVGTDAYGNRYYESEGENESNLRTRWVDYNQYYAEPSLMESGWRGWLTHMVDTPPTQLKREHKALQAVPRPQQYWNHTGTPGAYVPYSTVRPNLEKWSWQPTVKERV